MLALLKVMLIMATCFALTFLFIKSTGILSIEQIKHWLIIAKSSHQGYVFSIVVALLFADLFIAVPTLTIILLAGYFLGFHVALIASLMGMTLAGFVGYWLSSRYGEFVLQTIIKAKTERDKASSTFKQHGFIFILLSRAMPILPEVSACLAGIAQMPFHRFFLAWVLSTAPYATIASYAGSVSSISNPKPAIIAALGISGVLWCSWFFYHRYISKQQWPKQPL
ncbi:TVP38/TMEM64 family protein [Thalassotalea sp. PP2-459]|uniref:TVP38/TMEM64 family protein n=1 Tax=Thalassotalea sp. PP2-459 TaxID=1742724 RepID=UPI0009F95FE8|nr:VTT domain-containing protein [Thalassotalea sp. PP2-459]